MKIACISVGKKYDAGMAKAIDDCSRHLQRKASFEWQLLLPAKDKMNVDDVKRIESATIAAQLQDDKLVILLDEDGTQLVSRQLANMLDALDMQATGRRVWCDSWTQAPCRHSVVAVPSSAGSSDLRRAALPRQYDPARRVVSPRVDFS